MLRFISKNSLVALILIANAVAVDFAHAEINPVVVESQYEGSSVVSGLAKADTPNVHQPWISCKVTEYKHSFRLFSDNTTQEIQPIVTCSAQTVDGDYFRCVSDNPLNVSAARDINNDDEIVFTQDQHGICAEIHVYNPIIPAQQFAVR